MQAVPLHYLKCMLSALQGNSNTATCMKDVPLALHEVETKHWALEERLLEAWNGSNGEQLSWVDYVRPSRSKKAKQPTITEGLNQMKLLSLEDEWCLAFCESHLPWSVTDRPAMRAFPHHLSKTKINWLVPNRHKLSGPVLNRVETKWSVKIETVKAGSLQASPSHEMD